MREVIGQSDMSTERDEKGGDQKMMLCMGKREKI